MTLLIPTIGIEVHVELKTTSKVFSPSPNTYGEIANSKTNVIDLGYPGVLPTLNKEVVDLALKACLVTNCHINNRMYFDRKNYFYPDLSKGYQITQAETPIGNDGYIDIFINGENKRIEIERIHIEEDTAKSMHEGESTLLDFNRAGIPLIEIVTKPVIRSGEEAVLYLEKLRELLLYTDVSDVKIEEGSMRCDANVSLSEDISSLGVKTEVKNIGSIANVRLAINHEIDRQRILIENGEKITNQTRRFDEKTGTTILMRNKEGNNDYRYFPEPDIPYIEIDNNWINNIKSNIPLLPSELRDKYQSLGINDIAIQALVNNRDLSSFLNKVIETGSNPVISANIITGDILFFLNKHNIKLEQTKMTISNFIDLVNLIDKGDISSKIGKEILNDLLINGGNVNDIINNKNLKQISDFNTVKDIVLEVLKSNNQIISDYKSGNDKVIKYLVGLVMKESQGKVNPLVLNEVIESIFKDS